MHKLTFDSGETHFAQTKSYFVICKTKILVLQYQKDNSTFVLLNFLNGKGNKHNSTVFSSINFFGMQAQTQLNFKKKITKEITHLE